MPDQHHAELHLRCPYCNRQHKAILSPPSHTHILHHCTDCGHLTLIPLSLSRPTPNLCPQCATQLIGLTAQANDAPLCITCLRCLLKATWLTQDQRP